MVAAPNGEHVGVVPVGVGETVAYYKAGKVLMPAAQKVSIEEGQMHY